MNQTLTLTRQERIAIRRELASRSLTEYSKLVWPIVEPATKLKWGYALDAICAHLEAVTRGEITKLVMNVPPGTMKSLMTSVFWPTWEWGPKDMQWARMLNTSHSQSLAIRDAMKTRRVIMSDWFQDHWPVEIRDDQNTKSKFENAKTGFREAMAFSSMTGSRGDRVLLDDPISVMDANSEAELRNAEINFTETLPTRVNNEKSAIVVIMQRLHAKDTTGVILEKDLGYTHLCLPMRFEPDERCVTPYYSDWRTKKGELLFPERFNEQQVRDLEKTLGSYAAAGQLQQRPAPRGGGLFKRQWFNPILAALIGTTWIRGWDLAATEDDPMAAYTAGVLIGMQPNGRYVVGHATRIQGSPNEVEQLIKTTAKSDMIAYPGVEGSLPQDPGQAAKAQVRNFVSMLAPAVYKYSTEVGDKFNRALPFAAQAEAGNVDIVVGPWNEAYLNELCEFPVGKFKDQVDASSRAFLALTTKPTFEWYAGGKTHS